MKKEKVAPAEIPCFAFMITIMENRECKGPLPSFEIIRGVLEDVLVCTKYSCQKELPKSGQLHWQICVVLKNRLSQTQALRKIRDCSLMADFYGSGCTTVKPCRSQSDSEIYCLKEETRVEGPYVFPNNKYIGQDLPTREDFYPWQEYFISIIKGPIHPRDVHVFVNYAGHCGKSDMVKYAALNYGAISVPLSQSAERAKSAMIDAGYQSIYLIDLTRNTTKNVGEVYDLIEELKTGHIKTAFYGKFKQVFAFRPHIVLFMNYMPRVNYLSRDMWKIHEIKGRDEQVVHHCAYEIGARQAMQATIEELKDIHNELDLTV